MAVQRDREERNEEDPSEVALRVHDPRIGTRRPVRVEPDGNQTRSLCVSSETATRSTAITVKNVRSILQTNHTKGSRSEFYLSTVLDDFSRYIIAWKLCTTMKAEDVTVTLDLALKTSGLDQAKVIRRPRLLSDNGSSYIAADLAKWLDGQNIQHVRGAPPPIAA